MFVLRALRTKSHIVAVSSDRAVHSGFFIAAIPCAAHCLKPQPGPAESVMRATTNTQLVAREKNGQRRFRGSCISLLRGRLKCGRDFQKR